ncbi:MAG: beta-CASP ribonuclease aCPSF1 [Nitrospiraceae bacterium]|nr:beta-CASP ribonuclease aCPSF1 [Nitrospiraceae bacterium]
MSTKIIEEMKKDLPVDKISDVFFEGANIVFYTIDRSFFRDNRGIIKDLVNKFKKRIELRADPSIVMDVEKARDYIKKVVPKEAKISDILFDPSRSVVVIEAEKQGTAIGKQGSILKDIKNTTLWTPFVRREPPIKSDLINSIRAVLFNESDYRKQLLNRVGHRIYDGWIRARKEEWIRVSFLGGQRQVGKSCLFLQTPESRILLDCGIDVSDDNEPYPFLDVPEFNINDLDAVIVTHAHLDHVGFVPYLFRFGYKGPVYCTEPTRDVSALMCLDNIKIMRNNGKEPIYTASDVKEMVKHTICLDYDEVTDVTPDVRITLYNAGHILGSSMVHLHIGNGFHNMLYTGDIKYGRSELLEPAVTKFPRLETLIMESTYGGSKNIMPPKRDADKELIRIINETHKRGGKILIPVLGSGRAQEILVVVNKALKNKMLDKIHVYIDGMVWDITSIHSAYPEFLSYSLRKRIFKDDDNPFLSENLKRVGSSKERKEVIEEEGSCVILATSGMLVGGPSVEYLKQLASDPKNTLVFVSYQGVGSLGRRIQGGERQFSFSNGHTQEIVKVNLEVHTVEGFSGHSDRRQLLAFVNNCNPKPNQIIIVHGETSRSLDLARTLSKFHKASTFVPRTLDVLRIK